MLSRIKFEIDPVVNSMLDQLPADTWTSTTETFLDPAMAGGQFVREIERRLLAAGHSRENVAGRVYGIEQYEHQVQYAVNKYKLLGNYTVDDFLEKEFTMKFDNIVGNPPFQDGNQGIWQEFVKVSLDNLKNGGIISFITPNSWANGSNLNTEKNIFNSVFQKFNCTKIKTNVNEYFPKIGKNISQWTVVKEPYKGKTLVVDNASKSKEINILKYPFFLNVFTFEALEIFEKILAYNSFYSEFVEKAADSDRYYAFPKIRHNAGYRKGYRYDNISVDFPTSPIVVGIDCTKKSLNQVKSIHSQFESDVFKFLWKIYGADDAGSFGWILRNMPKLPDTIIYSNKEIYEILDLKKYQDYIESNVK